MFDYRETVEKLIGQEINAGQINGASMLVLHKGKEVYFDAFGYADKEVAKPMKRDTIIRLFSMSKPITAAAVMMLAERGEIDLRDNVSKYLPYFKEQTVWNAKTGKAMPALRENTIWDMLNMTSGIPYPNEEHEPGKRMHVLFREAD